MDTIPVLRCPIGNVIVSDLILLRGERRATRHTHDFKSATLIWRVLWPVKRALQMKWTLVYQINPDI